MFWTIEKIQEAHNRSSLAASVELPIEQLNELLSLADGMLKILKASQDYRAKYPVTVYNWPEYVEKLDNIIRSYPEPESEEVVTIPRKEYIILTMKAKSTLGNNLCPGHRDKQHGKPCLACTIEGLERKLIKPVLQEDVAVKICEAWKHEYNFVGLAAPDMALTAVRVMKQETGA